MPAARQFPDSFSGITELHVHLEGSLSFSSAAEIASIRGHKWAGLSPRQLRNELRLGSFPRFLDGIREMCVLLSSYPALERAAYELSVFLRGSGVAYAEVYCSPYIFVRWGLDFGEVLRAIDRGFSRGEEEGMASCRILLDSVRQWGPEAARLVLAGFRECRLPRVAGFGLGGDETVPLEEFTDAYEEARGLGLKTLAHAGEIGAAADVRKAIEILKVDRLAHGIRALDDPELLDLIVRRKVPLDLAVTSNYRTGAVRGKHPIRQLLDAGAIVTLSTDDPSIFRTSLPREYRRAAVFGDVSREELIRIAKNGIDCSFADESTKAALRKVLQLKIQSGE